MKYGPWILILAIPLIFITFIGCEHDPVSATNQIQDPQTKSAQNITFLKYMTRPSALNKPLSVSQTVTVEDGGQLLLQHGDENAIAANSFYVAVDGTTSEIYKIDPDNLSQPEYMGQLAFRSFGIALHPFNGKMYYVGLELSEGVYPVGVWDPVTNTNEILPNGSPLLPTGKLAFHPDGRLFGVLKSSLKKLQLINTETGEWSEYATLNAKLGVGGDMVFSPDGSILYSTGGTNPVLKKTDMSTNLVTNLNTVGPVNVSGLSFGFDGNLYASSKDGSIRIIDQNTGIGTLSGYTGISIINDMAPVIAGTELAYAQVILDVLPGAINNDDEFSLNMETTELQGGVAVVFGPHGTSFNLPALLSLEALGVDFTGIDPDAVDIFYDNPETGLWEPMEKESLIINVDTGYLKLENAELPHFSRYAIGLE